MKIQRLRFRDLFWFIFLTWLVIGFGADRPVRYLSPISLKLFWNTFWSSLLHILTLSCLCSCLCPCPCLISNRMYKPIPANLVREADQAVRPARQEDGVHRGARLHHGHLPGRQSHRLRRTTGYRGKHSSSSRIISVIGPLTYIERTVLGNVFSLGVNHVGKYGVYVIVKVVHFRELGFLGM